MDVARPFVGVDDRPFVAGQAREQLEDLASRHLGAGADIADVRRGLGSADNGLDGVVDVDIVACLAAIPKDGNGLVRRARWMKIGTAAAYWLPGSWRGPNTLK